MKITFTLLSRKLLLLCLLTMSLSGLAQSNFCINLANPENPTPTTLEVDVMLTIAAPAEGVLLSQVSTGVNFNPAILNGGTPCTTANCGSWAFIAGTKDAALSFLAPTTNTTRGPSPYGHLRIVGTTLTNPNSMLVPVGTYRLGRYRFTNTVPFTAGSDAQLWLQPTNAGGTTNSIVSWFVVGTTTGLLAYTTTAPASPPGICLSHSLAAPLSVILNGIPPCFTAGTYTQTPACVTGNNDGTATITMSPVPSSLNASYVLDGGASTPVTLSATGTFTLTGLAAGAHTLTVTGDTGCATPVSVPFTINAAPSVTPTFTQVGPFCSGATLTALPTTSTNGVIGSWAPALDNMNTGTYTFTPAAGQCATTATMTITITPSINTSTTVAACDTYTWAVNGVTYTSSGVYTAPGAPTSGIVNNLANWLSTAADNGATVSLNALTGLPTTPPATVTVGPVTATFSAPNGLYSSGTFISTNTANQPLTITFSTPVYGVSGNYFVTDITDAAIAGTITITYSDGTTETQAVTADTDFFGYFKNTTISSVVITPVATVPAVNRWATVKNLRVATSPSSCITSTLNLTITPSLNIATTVSACDSYTWTENGTTYTASGVYTVPSVPASGIVNNQANWLSTASANGATVSLNALTGLAQPPPATVTVGPVTATFSAPNGLYSSGTFISTNTANQPLTITFSTPVYGVSGNYFVTNIADAAIAGTITILYSDGTTETQPVTADTDFFGYFKNTTISSVVITPVATVPAVNRWATVKNLRVATSPSSCITRTLNLTITPSTTNGSVTTSICAGGSYVWPLPLGTGLTYTTAQTSVTNVVGCNTATLNLTVNPLTTDGSVTTSICAGGSYVWPLPLGTGLTYTTAQTNVTNVVGCNTATLNLTITPLTTNGSVTTSICAGGSYVWPLPLGTGLTYTTAQTNVTNVVGCNTATLNLTITPTTTNGSVTTSICAGGSYVWPLPLGTGLTYTTAQTNVTNVVGCNTATLNLTITTSPTPTGSSTQSFSVAALNDATVANLVVSPAGSIWYGTLLDAQNGTNPLAPTTVLVNGNIYYAVNVSGGCASTPFAVTVTVTLGNDQFDSLNFAFYPNPTSSVLNISYSRTISDIQVMNLLGQEVMTRKANDTEVQIDLSSLATATYFVKVTSEGKSKIIKVIKN